MQKNNWYCTVTNPLTGQQKRFLGYTKAEAEGKANLQQQKWAEQMNRLQCKQDKEEKLRLLTNEVEKVNDEINKFHESCESIISYDTFNHFSIDKCYKALLDKRKYDNYIEKEPPNKDEIYEKLGVKKEAKVSEMFFKSKKFARLEEEAKAQKRYENEMENFHQNEAERKRRFDEKKANFERIKKDINDKVNQRKQNLYTGDSSEIEYVLKCFIDQVYYVPDFVDVLRESEFQYIETEKTVVISRKLPCLDDIINVVEYKVVKSSLTVSEKKIKDSEHRKLYDDIVFQIALKTMKDIYDILGEELVQHIVFNGWIETIDTSTGNDMTLCVLSVESHADSFLKLNLNNVDYKECIKGLKGIFGSQIANLTPINPIMKINREDKRFVNDVDVSDILMDGFNLATMEWEDFEHLIRQLFEKIFSSGDSEVKVTQASRDGGVDAIAFDADPIRGGKVVIQAKRYNILVPVSAVRDLYGTVLHEGAIKGILVTTSNYGRDSYSFIKDKPVTLINGQELLGLMDQYGFGNVNIKLRKKVK